MSFTKFWMILVSTIQTNCFAPKFTNSHYSSGDNISYSLTDLLQDI